MSADLIDLLHKMSNGSLSLKKKINKTISAFKMSFVTMILFNFKKVDGEKVMRTGDFVLYNYTAAPFCVDRYQKVIAVISNMNGNLIVDKCFFYRSL